MKKIIMTAILISLPFQATASMQMSKKALLLKDQFSQLKQRRNTLQLKAVQLLQMLKAE